jgi:nanoRNase/pAp phosphatase (c-di-AMP/oligoRNAs hydrolase)
MFRGGGHANACGASVKNTKELKQLLEVADLKLKEFKEKNEELF